MNLSNPLIDPALINVAGSTIPGKRGSKRKSVSAGNGRLPDATPTRVTRRAAANVSISTPSVNGKDNEPERGEEVNLIQYDFAGTSVSGNFLPHHQCLIEIHGKCVGVK